jgi:hypothetical protein
MDGLFASLLQALNTVPAPIVPGEQGQAPTADPSSAARAALPADPHPVPDEGGAKGDRLYACPGGENGPGRRRVFDPFAASAAGPISRRE